MAKEVSDKAAEEGKDAARKVEGKTKAAKEAKEPGAPPKFAGEAAQTIEQEAPAVEEASASEDEAATEAEEDRLAEKERMRKAAKERKNGIPTDEFRRRERSNK